MNRPRVWREHLVGAAILLGLLAYWVRGFLALPPTDFDDAYMAVRYVRHVLDGHGFVWNPGDAPGYGLTSRLHFGWALLLQAVFPHLSPAALLRAASGSMALALLVAMPLAFTLWGRPRRFALATWSLVLLPALGFSEAFLFHASSGMDTMLSTVANLFVAVAAIRLCQRSTAGGIWVAVVAGFVAVLARPENAVPALLAPLLAVWFFAPVARGSLVGQLVLSTLGLWALDLGVCAHFLGSPLPLAFYVKRAGYYAAFAGEHGWNPYWFARVFLLASWPLWVAALAFIPRRMLKVALVFAVPFGIGLFALSAFNQIMGHLGRFYFPLLPFVLVLGAQGVDALPSPRWLSRRIVVSLAARLAVAGGLVWALQAALLALGQARADGAPVLPPLPGAQANEAAWDFPDQDSWTAARDMSRLMNLAPAGTLFAMSEHGLPGALAPHVAILDLLGLHDDTVAKNGFSAAALFGRGPHVLWMPHPDHVGLWRDIAAAPEFQRDYVFYRDAFHYGVAVQKGSRVFDRWPELMRRIGFPAQGK